MIRYGNPQEVEEYFADDGLNQSLLKSIINGVDNMRTDEKKMYYEEKGHFVIGSAVDVWLTQGKSNFDLQYFVFTGEKPSDTIMSIVQKVFDGNIYDGRIPDATLHDYGRQVLESADYHKYYTNWKEETRVSKIMESGYQYYEQLKMAYGKQILDEIELNLITSIVMSFQTHKYTINYFQDQKGIEKYHQVAIYFGYGEFNCKILLDKIIIDREKKTIQPIDIKTMAGNTIEFPYAVKARRYDFQAAFYLEGLSELVLKQATCSVDLGDLSGFKVLPFLFLVETTKTETNKLTGEIRYFTGKPLVFEMSYEQILLGKNGRPELYVDTFHTNTIDNIETIRFSKPIVGFVEALQLYKWHLENGFEYDKEVIENNGVILIE